MVSLFQLILFWLLFEFMYIAYRIYLLIIHKKEIRLRKHPKVSILVPAYNEEICIEKTLTSCIYQTYPNLEIIIINDGSTDKTLEVINKFKNKYENYLKQKNINLIVINQKNQGKAKALNNGKNKANGEFIVTIDADSYLNSHAIEKIISYFSSEKIGAVAGNIVAIAKHNLLGYLQKIEYELGIHFIRNSQSSIGSVIVTPGALSAYRSSALKKFEEGTLTEDFDSSIRILERGYEIVMAPDAICYTQVPISVADLIKQRIRWQQGGLEVFSKHSFHKKRISVFFEWIFLFLFGFYGLFVKMLVLFLIPLFLIISRDHSSLLLFIVSFFIYSIFIYGILFSISIYYSHDRKAILVVPLFIIYYYTIVLYAVLAAQILAFKGDIRPWEKIKRYHT